MSKLKEQTLFSASAINDKDLFWISKYVSGTEGSSGVYNTFRITAQQLRTLLMKQYSAVFTPDGIGAGGSINNIPHNLNSDNPIVQIYDLSDGRQILADICVVDTNNITVTFNTLPPSTVKIVIICL